MAQAYQAVPAMKKIEVPMGKDKNAPITSPMVQPGYGLMHGQISAAQINNGAQSMNNNFVRQNMKGTPEMNPMMAQGQIPSQMPM